MQRHAVLHSTARILTAAVLLAIRAHKTAATEPAEIFNELHLNNPRFHQLPSSSRTSFELPSEDIRTPRLDELLRLKLSMLNILSEFPEIDDQESDAHDELDTSRLTKRVFCNGFTGCGGRFRGRRRQQPPVAEIGKRLLPNYMKRPFCNSYGCYNNGKKRFEHLPVKMDVPQVAALTGDWFQDKIKKLFCNGYGGCQNVAKRVIVMDADISKAVNDELLTPLPVSNLMLEKLANINQAFLSDVDEDAGGVVGGVRSALLVDILADVGIPKYAKSYMEMGKVAEMNVTTSKPLTSRERVYYLSKMIRSSTRQDKNLITYL